jgi:hypothetical protein
MDPPNGSVVAAGIDQRGHLYAFDLTNNTFVNKGAHE